MSKLKQKSEFNIDAADCLIANHLYAPSVHCSYYSCFQLIKYIISYCFNKDYDQQSFEIRSSKQNSHQYVIKLIREELRRNTERNVERELIRKIKDLKQLREDADYNNIEIGIEKSNSAYQQAKVVREILVKNFIR